MIRLVPTFLQKTLDVFQHFGKNLPGLKKKSTPEKNLTFPPPMHFSGCQFDEPRHDSWAGWSVSPAIIGAIICMPIKTTVAFLEDDRVA